MFLFGKEGINLVTCKFKSIAFGVPLAILLHYVIKRHINIYPYDKLSKIMTNNFYVDNMLVTANETDEVKDLYHLAYESMKAGILRSWNSN